MGIIQKQSIKGTAFTYIGAIVGLINTAFLMPGILTPDEIGLVSLIVSYAIILSQFSSFGFSFVTTRMFAYFRDYAKNHNGFFFLLFMVGIIGFIIIGLIFQIIKPYVIEDSIEKSAIFVEHIHYVLPLVFFQLFFLLLDNYYKVLYNSVYGTFLKELILRLLVTFSVVLYFYKLINFEQFVVSYLLAFAAPSVFLTIKLLIEKQISLKPNFAFLDKKMIRTIASVGFYGILLSFSGVIVLNIDRIMINSILGIGQAGIYTIAFFFGSIILIPNRSLQKISSVVIADAWKKNDLKEIKSIYSKSCINQILIAVLLFIGIWGNVHNIFKILPEDYESSRYVILLIAFGGVVNMASGVSASIIANSSYYKVISYFMFIYITFIVALNYFLIPIYGISGAALASLISSFVFVLLKFVFLLYKYGYQPYNFKYIIVVIAGLLAFWIAGFIPKIDPYIIDISIRSILMTVIYVSVVLLFNVSQEANAIFISTLQKIKVTIFK